jgi:hypothetical protein
MDDTIRVHRKESVHVSGVVDFWIPNKDTGFSLVVNFAL